MFRIISCKKLNEIKNENKTLRNCNLELRNKLDDERLDYFRKCDSYIAKLNEANETINQKNSIIEQLNYKIDILSEYYDLNSEPDQETKTKIRINAKVHELELENIELRTQLRSDNQRNYMALNSSINSILNAYPNSLYSSLAQIPTRYY